jgi:large subunit ribosomal protein L25
MNIYEITAEPRSDVGKGASRRLRRQGMIPVVLYGAGKPPASLAMDHNELKKRLEHETFYSHILELSLGSEKEHVVLKDLQHHPSKPLILHMDLQRVDPKHELHMHVPLHFVNEEICPGKKTGGGLIQHHMVEVEVSCLPRDLPEFIEVDLAHLQAGEAIHPRDLQLPPGVSLGAGVSEDQPVVSVTRGRGAADEEEAPEGG